MKLVSRAGGRSVTGERVIATGGEWAAGLALVRGLRRAGYAPVAALSDPHAVARWSRAPIAKVRVGDPLVDARAHAADLADAAESLDAAALLPGSEASLLAVAEHQDLFRPGTAVGAPAVDVVRRAVDKLAVSEIAGGAGLETPPTYSGRQAVAFAGPFPAIVKPLQSVVSDTSGRRRRVSVALVADATELAAALAETAPAGAFVQPFIGARLLTVNGVAWEGRVVCAVHKRSQRTWPLDAGVFAYGQTVKADRSLEDRCGRLLAELQWSGIFNLQFLETAGGQRLLVDLNPRAYHSLALAIAAGANLPAVWCDLVLGRPACPRRARVGVWFRSETEDLRALWATARRGAAGEALRGLRPRRGTAHALVEPADPGPLFQKLRRVLADGPGQLSKPKR